MYTLETVTRRIKKVGVEKFIAEILSGNLPEHVILELSHCKIISGGYPNLSLIYSLS